MVVVTHKEPAAFQRERDAHLRAPTATRRANQQVVFFTDRSLYRPGQTIQFKGIALRFDHANDNYETVAEPATWTVVFRDVNGKEIARHKTRTNDYGSFSGSFTAPRDRLMGRMTIHVAGPQRADQRHRRGVQAAEVQGRSGRAEGRRQAERRP